MSNKYVQDIRKIVGIDVNQSTLSVPTFKPRIGAKQGIGYFNQDNQTVASSKKDKDQKLKESLDSGTVYNSDFDGGNYLDPADPYSNTYDYDSGTYEATDSLLTDLPSIIDSTAGTGMGNNSVSTGGTLNGITGLLDPESGQSLDLRFDGLVRPPVGWDSVDVPADEYDRWTAGTQWFAPGSPGAYSAVPILAAKIQRDVAHSDYTALVSAEIENFPHIGGSVRWVFVWERSSDNDQVSFYAHDESCSVSPSDPFCPLYSPIKHPADGLMQLVASGGKWQVSEYEPLVDVIPSYTDNQHSRIDAQFGSGRFISIIPTRNAGYVIGETDTLGGTLISDVNRVISAYGKVIDYITAAQLPGLLPK